MNLQTRFELALLTSVLLFGTLVAAAFFSVRMQRVRNGAQSHIYYGNTLGNLPDSISAYVNESGQTTETLVMYGVPKAFLQPQQSDQRLYVFSSWTTICYFYVDGEGGIIRGTYWTAT